MNRLTEQAVRDRASSRCEYCRRPQAYSKINFSVDHIVAKQHGGSDDLANLALACGSCNRHKGPNVAGVDPIDGQVIRLFNPRGDSWGEHVTFEDASIVGFDTDWPGDRGCVGTEL